MQVLQDMCVACLSFTCSSFDDRDHGQILSREVQEKRRGSQETPFLSWRRLLFKKTCSHSCLSNCLWRQYILMFVLLSNQESSVFTTEDLRSTSCMRVYLDDDLLLLCHLRRKRIHTRLLYPWLTSSSLFVSLLHVDLFLLCLLIDSLSTTICVIGNRDWDQEHDVTKVDNGRQSTA